VGLVIFIFLTFSSAGRVFSQEIAAISPEIWFDHERGWFWYEVLPEPEEPAKEKTQFTDRRRMNDE
jgi:hypothetical protein